MIVSIELLPSIISSIVTLIGTDFDLLIQLLDILILSFSTSQTQSMIAVGYVLIGASCCRSISLPLFRILLQAMLLIWLFQYSLAQYL